MEYIEFKEEINKYLKEINIELEEGKIEKFYKYMNLLIEWNKKINLTAIIEPKEIILKHFIDSIMINTYIKEKATIIDVGTGAGFPGIPLKILRDDIEVTLLDSLNKRIIFLDEVIEELKLEKIKTIHGRAEDYANNIEYREKFDIATSRAVANLATLSEYLLPFVKIGGYDISMKGSDVESEVIEANTAIIKLGGKIEDKKYFRLPNSDIERNIMLIKKEKFTHKIYPRKAGIPSKEPLK